MGWADGRVKIMNSIQIELQKDQDTSEWDGSIYADGISVDNGWTIDWIEIAKSAIEPGDYFIFTCGCGVPQCARIYTPVKVTHSERTISWHIIEPDPERHFEFSKTEYRAALQSFFRQVADTVPRPSPGEPFLFSHVCFWATELDWCLKTMESGNRDNSGWWNSGT